MILYQNQTELCCGFDTLLPAIVDSYIYKYLIFNGLNNMVQLLATFSNPITCQIMFSNYLKVAFRNLRKNKIYSLINITGLALALACVLVIVTYVKYELSYDKFHEHYRDIYRVTLEWEDDVQSGHSAKAYAPLADVVRDKLAGLDKIVRLFPYPAYVSMDKKNKFRESKFVFADSLFFEMFSFQTWGEPLTGALDHPFSVVVTAQSAIRYFGTSDVVGKELYFEDQRGAHTFNITGVIPEVPPNAHFAFEFVASFNSLETIMPWYNSWYYPSMYNYVQIKPGYDLENMQDQIQELAEEAFRGDHPKDKDKRQLYLQSLASIHLHSDLLDEWEANSNYVYIKAFVLIAVFVLIIACINFMNLATAQSARRAREVGMRKVMGAQKQSLITQFIGESLVTVLLSFLLAFGSGELLLMAFNKLIAKELSLAYLVQWPQLVYVLVGVLLLGLLAGLYPAFYLSRFSSVKALKGQADKGGGYIGLRRGMVIFQFFISSLMIISTLVVLEQVSYLRNKSLGFDHEQIIALRLVDRPSQINFQQLKDQLLTASRVDNVALSSTLPGRDEFYGFPVVPEDATSDDNYSFKTLGVDKDFLNTYKIEILEGRNFSLDFPTDQREAFILNEAAVEKFNWSDPIGKEFSLTVYTDDADVRKGKVIGIVKNFHFQSLYNQLEPLVIYINKHPYYSDFLSVRVRSGNLEETVAMLQEHWSGFNPDKPMEYYFMDQELDRLYHREVRIGKIFSSFAVFSIFISCLGLFGLSAFSAQRRIKEIGIRKVMGASTTSILRLLSREYLLLIAIANFIAWPLAWYLSREWLEGFAYRISPGTGVYLITLIGAVGIALLTVSFQSIKAAWSNPVDTLRAE